ncbi:MAG TPA: DUF1045 domain-containing protein [Geminicoccaceae bacterium]
MSRRFAIYFAAPEGSALEAFGRSWIGRDHVTGAPVAPPRIAGLSPTRQREVAAFPRHYGFHATLKAPFELAPDRGRDELLTALAGFAATRRRFVAPPVEVQALSGFIAFKLSAPSEDMAALAADCVTTFEPFRAPPRASEIERRRAAGLSARQDRYLLAWGYPYVFEEFDFHMTLTGRLEDPERNVVLEALRALALPLVEAPLPVDAVSLYEQPDRDRPFRLTARFPFGDR